MKLVTFLVAVALLQGVPGPATATTPEVPGREHVITRGGKRMFLWERCLPEVEAEVATSGRVLLFLHGATISGRPNFDLDLPGLSTLKAFAREGWDSFCLDMQGFGKSDDPDDGRGYRAEVAVRDVKAAVDFLCELRGVESVHLVGWSWGSQVAGLFAQKYRGRVASLVLYGSRWKALDNPPASPVESFLAKDRAGAAEDFVPGCYEQEVVDAYVEAVLATDPASPTGPLVDYFEGLPILDPAKIRVPTMVVMGEHEAIHKLDDQVAFFAALATRDKRFVVLPGGGHAILLERPRESWRSAVREFLEH